MATKKTRRNTARETLPPIPYYAPSERLLSPDEIMQAAQDVKAIAAAEGVRIILVGGAALQAYGSLRLTSDVDFAATLFPSGIVAESPLSFGGSSSHTHAGIPVDVIVRDDEYEALYDGAIGTAVTLALMPCPVVRPEELAAMKMVAGRDKDLMDLKFLIGEGRVNIDRAKVVIRRYLGRYGVLSFDRLLEEVAWSRSRRR